MVTIEVRHYTEEGEQWAEVEVRPDAFLGNEVTVKEEGVRPRIYTGIDIAKLVEAIATGKYKEANSSERFKYCPWFPLFYAHPHIGCNTAVSYTHLTLPTICSV
eukprot:TRINITY_DN4480_c0_g1_i12.p3 TRINITY_DN4480_c0_g1~~TRINITY_DN4480_c0_g1_i12.p3  ORF type:complete len:104 (-),score=19.44 TRINITY_DN4480_c0_g1_i12:48-359(-)